ncbi:MAG: hypothetical protein GKR94_12770 [Gammaproteobacteria bacterium]|nr:hypothetical protein [Gammaproteobacteria bacterium]
MAKQKFSPEKITSPIQLLAVWFVSLIALDGAFLGAAATITAPDWLLVVLVVAAVLNVPIFLGCMFLLQTRFRAELQSDEHYSTYIAQRRERAESLADEVRGLMDEAGLDLQRLVQGVRLSDEVVDSIRPLIEELADSIRSLERTSDHSVDSESLLTLAHGELVVGNWLAGAEILERYAQSRPHDCEANYLRGVAFANDRDGKRTDRASLRAYNDTIAFLPEEIDDNFRARVHTYREAILKRMRRFDEALADFTISLPLVRAEYERADLFYNFASTYAMKGDRERMLESLWKIPEESGYLRAVYNRRSDYFQLFANDPEFLAVLSGANTAIQPTGEDAGG